MEQKFCPNCAQPLAPDAKFCEYCGFSTVQNWDECPHALPYGTVLGGRYITGRVLGRGGFGITYIAKDFQTGQRVAIKEYFPDAVASRGQGNSIVPYTGQANDDFNYGKAAFLEEAKTLAQFVNEPGIVHIHSYFEEFGTAYFSMELVDGVSLQKYIEQSGGKIGWDEAKRILLPVMDALGKVHSKGIIHRDIKPDNIYLTKDGSVKILDFGSARYSMGEKSRSLDVVLTHGFAPKEQYSRHGRQGAYTDVYALAATFYYAVTGRKPQDSIDRMDSDSLAMPNSLGARIPSGEEEVLLKALSVDPQDRFPTMAAFRQALEQGGIPAAPQGYANYQQPAQQPYPQPAQQPYRQPAQQPYRQPVQQTYQQPVQQTYQQPAQQTYQQPAQQPYQQPVQQTYQQPVQQTYQQPAQQTYPQPVQPTKKKNGWLLPVILGSVALIGLVIGLVLLLGGKKNDPQLDATTEPPAVTQEPTVEPTQSTEPAPTMQTLPTQTQQDDTAELAGYYTIQSISMNGITYDVDAIRENLADPETFYLIMREDGTGAMGYNGEENDLTWTERGTMVMEDTTIDFTAEDGTIRLAVALDDGTMHMVFARTGSAPQPGQSSDGLSGTCGASAAWVFDPDSGTLTISGEGAIYDYSDTEDIPWYSHRDDIKSLEIEEGITRIGNCAFYECAEWYINLPKSVTSIGKLAFAFSQKLYTANIPSSVKSMEDGAFYQCASCENVYMHCTQLELGENVFASCKNLRFLLFYGNVSSIGSNAFYDDENMVVYTPDTSAWSSLAKKDYGGAPIWMVGGADGTIYKADKYDVFLPKDWDDNCTAEVDGDVINVYHTASKNAGYGGFLFGLNIYEKESDYNYLPSYQKIGTLKKSGVTYDLVAIFPTDVQTDGSHQSSYMKYYNEIEGVLLTIYGRNSFSLWFD